jgi:hypothetical protein
LNNAHRFSPLISSVLLTVVLAAGVATADKLTFPATFSRTNEVPPVVTAATGFAPLILDQEGRDFKGSVVFHCHQDPTHISLT